MKKTLLKVVIKATHGNQDTLADSKPHSLCAFKDESFTKGLCRQKLLRFRGLELTCQH